MYLSAIFVWFWSTVEFTFLYHLFKKMLKLFTYITCILLFLEILIFSRLICYIQLPEIRIPRKFVVYCRLLSYPSNVFSLTGCPVTSL